MGIAIVVVTGMYSFEVARIYESAERVWMDTLARNPESWLAHAQLGQMYLDETRTDPGRMEGAIAHLREVVRLQPGLALGYANLEGAYVMAGRGEEARRVYLAGLEAPVWSRNDRARLYQGLGSLAARGGKMDEAEGYFLKAVDLDPESFSIHFALGAIYLAEGKLEKAHRELERAAEIEPGNSGVRDYLARVEKVAATTSAPGM